MNIEIVNSAAFRAAYTSYLTAAFWCQTNEDEPLDSDYSHDDCSQKLIDFIEGETLAIMSWLEFAGFDNLRIDTYEAIFHGLGGSATGAGIGLNDNGPIFPLEEEDMEALDEWHRKRWGVRTLNMYPGDDGKVYLEGAEQFKPQKVKLSLSERKGKLGAMFELEGLAVSPWALVHGELVERAKALDCKFRYVRHIEAG